MKTEKELAAARVTVKRAIRKKLHEITGDPLSGHIISGAELYQDDHLYDNLQRIRFRHNQTGETFGYNSDLSTRHFIMRDYVTQIMLWIDAEGKEYQDLWDLQSDITTGRTRA